MIREVTVFSEGDSLDLNCWSNVPFLFTKALENKGIKVNRVDIYSNKYIRKTIWKYVVHPIISFFYKDILYTYEQTLINRFLINFKIKKALRKYVNSDLNIYMSYAFLQKSQLPNILFSDWSSEYILKYRLKRYPYLIEKKYLNIQRDNIRKADFVISLFPDVADAMRVIYEEKDISYLGQNVINNAYHGEISKFDTLRLKSDSNILLFIGRDNYLEGARALMIVFPNLKKRFSSLELHIVGLSENSFSEIPNGVFCYSYLDKSDPEDNQVYYDLLLNAKMFINPTPQWGGFSSTVEAMYFYTPVVVSNYSSFVETFGHEIDFGYYLKDNSVKELYDSICRIIEMSNYEILCSNAHERVKSFTWGAFVDRFLEQANTLKMHN